MSTDDRRPPLFEVIPDQDERPEPLIVHTSEGTLSVAADLTAEEFEILDELRRVAAKKRG
ncbi:hypothetical protein OHA77_17025 [Streptosporangium sp. NBC_01639]|uniref:hypothetical protein n=1 Tax=unclassified Streptosporangium TaxID=2632669 RepID=UPI002DD7D9B1|nr:hypothetical protein [Streptosporangium sp. NBC_01756]WSC83258.1 hypothetical protein OIE48_22875 [Streptosporangium sp. NBC_01756]WTD58164.1 hypothetical protein OHA77_17025 [Streptosporangium sp. NBC_01639]